MIGSFRPPEANHEAPRVFETSRHYRRSRCNYQQTEREHSEAFRAHCPPRTGPDWRAALHHRFRRNSGEDVEPGVAANLVAEAVDRGINYFDIAPSYGNAQERLGPALAPYRNKCFLACKTEGRMKDDSRAQLEESLKLLKTDHVDLYQFHALTKMADLDKVLGPGGAMETMEAAKKEGKIRFIGFSVHSVETALAALDRYNFDTVLFPVNWVLYSQAELRAADFEAGAGKEDGRTGAEEHGQDGLAGRGKAASSPAQLLV